MTIALIVILVILVLYVIITYNKFVTLKKQMNNSYSVIDVYLKKRFDLIPNLVNTVKGYTNQEQAVIDSVTDARAKLAGANSVGEKANADQELSTALSNLLVVVENYPDLKSSQNFINLSDELAGTENRIATARKDYNDAVKEYNTKIKRFPTNIVSGMFGYGEKEYFQASEGIEEVPTVDFNTVQ